MRRLLICSLMLAAGPAFAANQLCVVDFQKAIGETNEGKSAQRKLDQMTSSRQTELERMKADLDKAVKDYEARREILSATARQEEEQKLLRQEGQLRQSLANAEAEMQQTYFTLLGDLDQKLRTIVVSVGTSAACSVVLDRAAVVYAGSEVKDITTNLVSQYNKQYPGQ